MKSGKYWSKKQAQLQEQIHEAQWRLSNVNMVLQQIESEGKVRF